ncbi:hypothetical protein BH09ACT7_BH09ACT7_32870 [soil metagenome]
MTGVREDDLAWDLTDGFGGCLEPADLTAAYVGLGVGDYTPVIHTVLHALARKGDRLPTEMAARVQAWSDCYQQYPPNMTNRDQS